MTELPYYFVRRLRDGRWCVAHRVEGTGVDHVDVECLTLQAAQAAAARMEQHRDCGWQLPVNVGNRAAGMVHKDYDGARLHRQPPTRNHESPT